MVRRLPPRQLLVIMALALLGVLAGGGLYYSQYQRVLSMAKQELQTIAQLKVDEIVAWRQEHLADAAAFADTLFAEVVKYWLENPPGAVIQTLLIRFQALQGHYGYADILLVDPSGAVRLSLSGHRPPPCARGHPGAGPGLARTAAGVDRPPFCCRRYIAPHRCDRAAVRQPRRRR